MLLLYINMGKAPTGTRKIIHNPKVTQKDPRRSPRANLNTVITSIDVELINESIELTSNPFNKADTIKYFEHDLIDPPFRVINGSYTFPAQRPRTNAKYLQKISEGNSKLETETYV